jgi:hypothetical protein
LVGWDEQEELQERAKYYEEKAPQVKEEVEQTANQITRNFLMRKYNQIQEVKRKTRDGVEGPYSPARSKVSKDYSNYYRIKAANQKNNSLEGKLARI